MNSKRIPSHWTALTMTLSLFVCVVAWESSLIAQVTTGTILGTVKDQSGAVLPGASVTATNVETGITRNTTSGSRGEYRLSALAVGSYEVHAEMTGFQGSLRSGITLTIGREAVVDFTLQVGNVAEQVTVTGEAPLVETTTATVSGVVTGQQLQDISLNARSFIELVATQAGAVFAEAGDTASPTWGFGRKLAVVGTRFNANSFLLDGADINNVGNVAGSAAGTMAGVETVREFRVITNAYDAEYGRHSGAVVSAITKSGTNQFHGSLFEFLRNDNLDAAKWEDNKFRAGEKPEFRRNQYGGTIGGPILRDRTFFFGSYEGLRQALGRTEVYDVPGVSARNGLINGSPVQNISPVTMPYLLKYPEPNVACAALPNRPCIGSGFPFDRADGTARYSRSSNQVTDEDFFTVRVDNSLSDSDSFFGRFNTDDAIQATPGLTTQEELTNESRFATLEETHIFSSALLGRTHFSYNRTRLDSGDFVLDDFSYPDNFVSFDGGETPGRITVTNLTAWGGGSTNPKHYVQNVFQFKEDMYYSVGRHSLKFGGQFERFQLNDTSGFHDGGSFGFSGLQQLMQNVVNSANFTKPGSDNVRGSRQNLLGLYLQDDISVRPGLTINMGLRYEIINSPIEVNGKMSNIRDLTSPHIDTVTEATVDIGEPYFTNPSLKNFAPRIGFAWDPFGSGRSSVRGGFGMYHDQILPGEYRSPLGRSGPFYAAVGLAEVDFRPVGGINFPRAYFVQRDRLITGGGAVQFDGIEWNMDQPTVYKWSLDLQRELASDTTIEAGYSGTRSTHLLRSEIMYNTSPSTFINGRRFILISGPLNNTNFDRMRWRTSDATSDYHGLRLNVTKRFNQGLQFQASYTYSKATDDSSNFVGSGDFGSSNRNAYRMDKEHGLTAFDVRNSFSANMSADLPGANLTGAVGKILGGWSLSSSVRFNSGFPVSLTAEQARIGSAQMRFVGGSTLDLVSGGDQNPISPQNPDNYFDVSQFAFPAANCITVSTNPATPTPPQAAGCDPNSPRGAFQGNAGRNHLTVPGIGNVNLTVMKETPLGFREGTNLQFRSEFFNLLNRPNFGTPNLQVFDRTGVLRNNAGQIESTRTSAREIQFAVKLIF